MKKLTAALTTFIATLLFVFGFAACNKDNNEATDQTVRVTDIVLSETQLTLEVGNEFTLTATVTPDGADKTVIWTSSDDNIVKAESGKITAVSAGTATVTAKAGEKTATCTVTVNMAEADFIGIWNFYKLVIYGNSYIVGVDDESIKKDCGLDNNAIVSESYKLILNADGTAVYTEEWSPVPCRWEKDNDEINLNFDNGFQLTLLYSDGMLGCSYAGAETYFKK